MCAALSLLALLAPVSVRVAQAAPPDTPAKRSPLLAAMQAELDRSGIVEARIASKVGVQALGQGR